MANPRHAQAFELRSISRADIATGLYPVLWLIGAWLGGQVGGATGLTAGLDLAFLLLVGPARAPVVLIGPLAWLISQDGVTPLGVIQAFVPGLTMMVVAVVVTRVRPTIARLRKTQDVALVLAGAGAGSGLAAASTWLAWRTLYGAATVDPWHQWGAMTLGAISIVPFVLILFGPQAHAFQRPRPTSPIVTWRRLRVILARPDVAGFGVVALALILYCALPAGLAPAGMLACYASPLPLILLALRAGLPATALGLPLAVALGLALGDHTGVFGRDFVIYLALAGATALLIGATISEHVSPRRDRRLLTPRERGRRVAEELDVAVRRHWNLGRNDAVGWMRTGAVLELLVAPSHEVLKNANRHRRLFRGTRQMGMRTFREVAAILGCDPIRLDFRDWVGDGEIDIGDETIESVVQRFALSRTDNHAVLLFDIVNFSVHTSVQQVAQLNSLEYSISIAQKRMAELGLHVDLARSSTGDGFYVWNRDKGLEADLRLYYLAMLTLSDNAIARSMDSSGMVPEIRTCFHVGGHFSYHQIDNLNPKGNDYIVGDVTIKLARLAMAALPGQILLGDLMQYSGENRDRAVNTEAFITQAAHWLGRLNGLVLSNHPIEAVKSYLTGPRLDADMFGVSKLYITDKHGITHAAFNAKVNIYRQDAPPMFLGLRHADIESRFRMTQFRPSQALVASELATIH